ncbi:glycosyltransferase family 4 protein [Maridesulfovibrio frigidus]|uniref:glycosyltransferase family 4 protein n=1 Tax=Maridesulfovibrio frigidus TaxID=340956 RepID=UPI0004E0D825|nr:glycosyltransferase family 4 protein [Maridesulfovibrio frigidus]
MNILFLTQSGPDLPSVRFRVLPFVERARQQGHTADWKRIPKAFHKRIAFFLSIPKGTVIIIQKKLLTGFQLSILKNRSLALVFDFDDALWTSHPSSSAGPRRDKSEKRDAALLENICSKVDLVIAGNNYLRDRIKSFNPNIEIIPTPLDTDKYVPSESRLENKKIIVGWMGTSCNLFFLPEVFKELADKMREPNLYVVSDKPLPPSIADLADFEKWSGEAEVQQLQKMDVGLMPLTDDEYTRGKCGFKILQYMACGAVPLASDVGFNREIIEHGINGFLIKEQSEWGKYVNLLTVDPDLRCKMAKEARKTVVDRFSLAPLADKMLARIETIIPKKPY